MALGRILKKTLKVAIIAVLAALGLITLLAGYNLAATAIEKAGHKAPGRLVTVDGREMHLYTEGSGPRNLLLLSGLGTTSPLRDFRPLLDELKKDYRVTVVERFGYGWSGPAPSARSNGNIVEEMRIALEKAGIEPPYVIVGHSIAGLYALRYSIDHPAEVSAFIGLDSSIPEQAGKLRDQKGFNLYGAVRWSGLLRLALALKPELLGKYDGPGYTDEDRRIIRMLGYWNVSDASIWDETERVVPNCRELLDAKFPDSIPVVFALSKTTVETSKSTPSWLEMHEKLIQGKANGKIVVLEGLHYIHWNNVGRIAELVKETVPPR